MGLFLLPGLDLPALLLPPLVASFRRSGVGCGVVLALERSDVMAGRVEVLAAGQAPWAAHRLVAVAADPESGRVLPAVDAQLDGVRQQAGHGYRAPPGVRGRGSGPGVVGR